jgi:dihydrofolate reductase
MDRYANVEYGFEDFLNGVGAIIMGRRSYDIGVEQGWFGQFDYGSPIFVVTSDIPESPSRDGDFTFVTEGIKAAHNLAAANAGNKNIWIFGGAHIAQQYAQAELLDEIIIGLVPSILGDGKRLFEKVGKRVELQLLDIKKFDEDLVLLSYGVNKS